MVLEFRGNEGGKLVAVENGLEWDVRTGKCNCGGDSLHFFPRNPGEKEIVLCKSCRKNH